MCLYYALPHWDWGDLGKYALIGASAQLGKYIQTFFLREIALINF